jgi:hypothetical protein
MDKANGRNREKDARLKGKACADMDSDEWEWGIGKIE